MAKLLTLSQPDISNNILTFIAADVAKTDVTIQLKNTAGLNANDFLLFSKFGFPQTEIVRISSVDSPTQVTLVSGCLFPHASDTTVFQIPYDKFRIYRSLTGVGGSYTLLAELPLQVDELMNVYRDPNAQSPYSYQFSYLNSFNLQESVKSDEIPFTGYPDWSLKSIQDTVLDLFNDPNEEFITRSSITTWVNECYRNIQNKVQPSDSPYDVVSATITWDGRNDSSPFDLTSLSAFNTSPLISIYRVEYSTDGGLNFPYTITPKDFRIVDDIGSIGPYDYRLAGTSIFIAGNMPAGYIIRIWYTTLPSNLSEPTDVLKDPFKPFTMLFVNYCLMRAHEKDRKMTELATYYKDQVKDEFDMPEGIVSRIRARIKQGNKAIATTWEDDYGWI